MAFSFKQRWHAIFNNTSHVLSMNRRNLRYIYPNNQRMDYPLADNKLNTKVILEQAGVPHPKTYFAYRYFFELRQLQQDLQSIDTDYGFVIKPASGRGGGGIKVIAGRKDDLWHDLKQRNVSLVDIRNHLSDIVFGIYSFDLHDHAIVEQRVQQHAQMELLSPLGLADVRIIMAQHKAVMGMLRIPTEDSDGKANLHQGALGVGIDMDTGKTCHAIHQGKPITLHPDTKQRLLGLGIPHWSQLLDICHTIAELVPLKYLGIDVAISNTGPTILEINVRPGIEIQNANHKGMREALEKLGIS